MAKKKHTEPAPIPRKKMSIPKVMTIIFMVLMALAIIGSILPEPSSNYVKVDMDDYPEWITFSLEKDAPASDSEALIDAADCVAKYNSSEADLWDYMTEEHEKDDVAYAKAHLTVDWKKVCEAAALRYAEEMSRQSVLDQLKFNKFTEEQINYANKALEAVDFEAVAAKQASDLKKDGLTPKKIFKELTTQQFTKEEASYALDQLEK